MAVQRLTLRADSGFWPAAAMSVLAFARRADLPARDLHALTWVVPIGEHALAARRALHACLQRQTFVGPRIVTLAQWLDGGLAASVAARTEMYAALRANDWVRACFSATPVALWALARDILALCDELTFAAAGSASAFEDRLQDSLARHYRERAAYALDPQAQLVVALWRVWRARDEGAAAVLQRLHRRAQHASAPLVYLASTTIEPWESAFLDRYAQGAPVLLIEASDAEAIAAQPLLAAAWPELVQPEAAAPPLLQRARGLPAGQPSFAILAAASLEQEAMAVAQQVLDWLSAGVRSIALVALDRLTARRARALLERAQVRVRDETGWRLSTTAAAAAVMRWLDVAVGDLYWRDLLDWLKSGFALADRPQKAQIVAAFERAIRAEGVLQGAEAIGRALQAQAAEESALQVLATLRAEVQTAQRARTLTQHLQALTGALAALGMRAGLAADAAGRLVLDALEDLREGLAGEEVAATATEFRALLAQRFEEVSFVDEQIDSPVVMLSLSGTALRSFDAVLVIGADAEHLPRAEAEALFLSSAVRAELGLTTTQQMQRRQAARFGALLAAAPQAVVTWRTVRGDGEPNRPSPLLERLLLVAEVAGIRPLQRAPAAPLHPVRSHTAAPPAPSAPQQLPARLSIHDAQDLVDCPYRFYAHRLLGLRPLQDVVELPDKRQFGQVLHEVLRAFHAQWGAVDFAAEDRSALCASLAQHAQQAFAPLLARTPALLAYARRFEGLIPDYIDWLRGHAAQGWRFAQAEVACRRALPLADGRTVELVGRLDRIDCRADGATLVLDYKARSGSTLRAAVKAPDEEVQLALYGFLLGTPTDLAAAYLSLDRAREDRRGVELVAAADGFADLAQKVAERLHRDLQRIAAGAPLPALGDESTCEHCDARGLCRRDHWHHGNGR
ncbi:MAG: PD-(D/E)XK nuclease family protein [Burkholderiaceae bacterium]|nr:PD-(D/E)XK nuclease family protein [Burkholderiaceae bacterium]